MTSRRVTSRWGRPTAERWLATWAHEPVLVAESLRRLPDPLEPILGDLRRRPVPAVVAAVATALRPARAEDAPPPWLRTDQVGAFRRTLAATRRYDGALLAESVGTGKTWIALAVARAVAQADPVVLAPAALVAKWRAVARDLSIAAQVHSHESVSRGNLPRPTAGLVVVDESHWYREPQTRRYRQLAPWLIGQRGLLISATPVVNRTTDLANQLRLCLRDDALSAAGLASLRTLSADSAGVEALEEVVICGEVGGGNRPALVQTASRVRMDRRLGSILRELDRLGLSTDPGVAALVRTSLWGAAASSPAALAAALLRYLALLDHAEDAARGGHRLGREALRRWVATDLGQLLLWELLPIVETTADLVLADRPAVMDLRARAARAAERPDPKVLELQAQLADGRPTLVFARSIITVDYLRRHLAPGPVAWCTGARSGIGATELPRDAVLAWFAPGGHHERLNGLATPRTLVTTDVVAEGLDLHGAARVIHYDLPWTAVRTEQRAGRILRLGSPHEQVAEHWLLPPRMVAARLGLERAIDRKRHLPRQLGLGEEHDAWWRRRQNALRTWREEPGAEGIAQVAVPAIALEGDDAIACVRIELGSQRGVTRQFVHGSATGWRRDEARALALLQLARGRAESVEQEPGHLAVLRESLAEPVRAALREALGRQWDTGIATPAVARLLRRLRHWARIAARARDAELLTRLDRAVRGLGRGHTAGEEIRLAQLAARTDATLQEHLSGSPAEGAGYPIPTVRLVGLIGFVPAQAT